MQRMLHSMQNLLQCDTRELAKLCDFFPLTAQSWNEVETVFFILTRSLIFCR